MIGPSKAQHRARLLAARKALPVDVRAAEAGLLIAHLPEAVDGAATVCAYLPVGSEPGSPAMVDRLDQLCRTVLLPVTGEGPLRWGRYVPGAVISGPFGLREPAEPWLPAEAVAEAEVVLVPALAVDRSGTRLGRGGGFYDRTLPLCRPGTRLVAVVRDDELVESLPAEPHDVAMTHALTPAGGLITLARESPPAASGSST